MRNLWKWRKKILFVILVTITLLIILHPSFNGCSNYDYIARDEIWKNLHLQAVENVTSNVNECDYKRLLIDTTTLTVSDEDGDLIEGHHIRDGGEYVPVECKPKFSTAIIVPYR